MSVTVVRKPHIHLPWSRIAIVLGAALAATAILVLVNHPWESTTETSSVSAPAVGAAAVPKPESLAQIKATLDLADQGFVPTGSAHVGPRNPLRYTTLDVAQPGPVEAPSAPTTNQHPLNFVP